MYATDPGMYYLNLSFLIKMMCLLTALGFHYTIRRKTVKRWTSGSGESGRVYIADLVGIGGLRWDLDPVVAQGL